MRQIFLNIYGNCIKCITDWRQDNNGVGLYSEVVDGITTYEWTITDTGIGME